MSLYPLTITPAEFRATLLSHGWFDLEPFKVDIENLNLELAFKNQHGDGAFKVFGQNGETFCDVLHGNETLVVQVVENCLSLDIDLSEMYSLVNDVEGYKYDYSKNSNILWNYKKGDTIEFICGFVDGEIDFIAEAKIIGCSSLLNTFPTAIIKERHRRKCYTRLDNGELVEIKKNDKRFDLKNSCYDRVAEAEASAKLGTFFDMNTESS
jgi:hypothetical protein